MRFDRYSAIPRLVVAGTASGVGKTTFVVGLVMALRARGLKVAVFKCGPDYLDPTYHARAAGTACHNLDGWMMGREAVLGTFARTSAGADIAIIEGVMGLFDGASPKTEEGSTAEIAKWLDSPVLLVVDVSGMARTIAAIAAGFAAFDSQLRLAGLICSHVGSKSHLELLRQAVDFPPVVGGLPEAKALSFPRRHLGLRTADERAVPSHLLSGWGDLVRDWCDLESIMALAHAAPVLDLTFTRENREASAPRCRIGIAFDEAFHFYYEDNLKRLENAGAELIRFSPVHDSDLPAVDGLYIGGGYPEIDAAALSANEAMRHQIVDFSASGGVVYAECGGLMYLCSALRTTEGDLHPMCGLIPADTVMCDRLQALGYVEVETLQSSILGGSGLRFRGHQFRYSNLELKGQAVEHAYTVRRRRDGATFSEGYRNGNTLASYVHAHWASQTTIPERLVAACVSYKQGRTQAG